MWIFWLKLFQETTVQLFTVLYFIVLLKTTNEIINYNDNIILLDTMQKENRAHFLNLNARRDIMFYTNDF